VGHFSKDCTLYYKEVNSGKFLVVALLIKGKLVNAFFDLFVVSAKSEKDFLLKRNNRT